MKSARDSYSSKWRRRVQRGSRDIAVAVVLTALAISVLGMAWLGNVRRDAANIGPSAEVKTR